MRHTTLSAVLIGALIGSCVSCQSRPPILVEEYTERFDSARFEVAVHALKENCTLNAPSKVAVKVIHAPVWGQTSWHPWLGMYVIEIEARNTMQGIIDTLVHEWAHAMVWDATRDVTYDDHGPMWGVAQARAYRVVLAALQAYNAEQAALREELEPEPEVGDSCFRLRSGVHVDLAE